MAAQKLAKPRFDPKRIKQDFPIFARNPGLVFLDTAASAQKPAAVIDEVSEFYRTDYANIHRGVYRLSARSTERYEVVARDGAAFPQRARRARDRVRAQRDRGDQPRRL